MLTICNWQRGVQFFKFSQLWNFQAWFLFFIGTACFLLFQAVYLAFREIVRQPNATKNVQCTGPLRCSFCNCEIIHRMMFSWRRFGQNRWTLDWTACQLEIIQLHLQEQWRNTISWLESIECVWETRLNFCYPLPLMLDRKRGKNDFTRFLPILFRSHFCETQEP